ncbi:hypothetical protein [Lacticaseibacillus suibinensis]|uniref:hypothetical protein n=1 Tax=Lacticaseibacillus suibinensis TaxID=2486011 RepID=UPI000F788CA4|nr:hypothetical protein [Lacticaseibacillus suibinensis]
MDMNPVLKLVPIALPKAGKRHDTQLPVLKTVRDSEGHGRDFFVFDMEINQRAFAVSFIAGDFVKPWLLAFNRKGDNQPPLVVKIYTGYKVATDGYSVEERKHISSFFNHQLNPAKGFLSLWNDVNRSLHYRKSSLDYETRNALLNLQDKPEEETKLFFKGFHNNGAGHRSAFNAWKVQHLLPPEVWAQIANNDHYSVDFTDLPGDANTVNKTEQACMAAEIAKYRENHGLIS